MGYLALAALAAYFALAWVIERWHNRRLRIALDGANTRRIK